MLHSYQLLIWLFSQTDLVHWKDSLNYIVHVIFLRVSRNFWIQFSKCDEGRSFFPSYNKLLVTMFCWTWSSGDVFAWSIDIEQSVPDYQGYLELGVKYDFDGELNLGEGWKIYLNKYWEHAFDYYLDSLSPWNIGFVFSVLCQVRGCFYKE